MTEELFRGDAYLSTCEAMVLRAGPEGIVLDRTVFYPEGGGQPGDTGTLALSGGGTTAIADTRKDRASGEHRHIPAESAALPAPGDTVTCAIDWDRRYRHMRVHTAMHLMCAVIDGAVTGGQVGDGKGRLDFDLPDTALDKAAIGAALNSLIEADLPVGAEWISDDELAARPESGAHPLGQAPDGRRLGPPAADRRRREYRRSPALRRHPCRAHRRDRPGRHRQDRKQGPPQQTGEPAAGGVGRATTRAPG